MQQNRSHKKQTNIQRVVIYYSHTVHLITSKANMIYTEMMTLRKLKRAGNRNNQLREKGDVVSGKKRGKIIQKTKSLPHMQTRIQ